MASRVGPRSVSDATRFTSSIPHAASKSMTPKKPASMPGRQANPAATGPVTASRIPGETPEQRVRRLRQAHLLAQKAQVSRTDRVIDASRRFLDVAHRWTVGGIVIFTAVAGIVSVYSVWDMLRYNRARRAEWLEAQKQLSADELATARLAYLKGIATPEQTILVEEANREAAERGVKLPPLLAPPEHRTHFEETFQPALQGTSTATATNTTTATGASSNEGQGIMGVFGGLFGGASAAAAEGVNAVERTGEEVVQSAEAKASSLQDKAKSAWEQEKANQRAGGSLDKLGLDTTSSAADQASPAKKSWRPW